MRLALVRDEVVIFRVRPAEDQLRIALGYA